MNNYYIEKLEKLEKTYEGRFNRVIDELKVGAEAANRLREDLKVKDLSYFIEEANNTIIDMKKDYIEKCSSILEESMPIPEATKYTELDIMLMERLALAREDNTNKEELQNILNEYDFNILKGQLIKNANEEGNIELRKELKGINRRDEEFFRKEGQARTNQQAHNPNYIPGLSIGTQLAINKEGILNYLGRVAGVEAKNIDMFD